MAEDIRAGAKVTVPAGDAANLKAYMDELAKRERWEKKVDREAFERIQAQYAERVKLAKKAKEISELNAGFIQEAGQGYFNDDSIARAAKYKAELASAAKEAQTLDRIQKEFAEPIEKAQEKVIDARYGDDAERVKLLVSQSVDDERKRLDLLVAQKAVYADILAAANPTAKAEAGRLAALDAEKTKLTELAKAEKTKLAELEKADKKRRETVEKAEAKLKADAEKLIRDSNPFADFIDELGKLQAMFSRGLINASQYDTERDRLVNEGSKTEKLNSAPRIEKGSQEAFKALTQQSVDRAQLQLNESQKQTLLASTAADVDKRKVTLLEELVNAQPSTVGP